MIKESVRRFLGPVKKVHSAFTELEDGGIYFSPEQIEMLVQAIRERKPMNTVDFTLGMIVGTQTATRKAA